MMTSAHEIGEPVRPTWEPCVSTGVVHRADITAIAVTGDVDVGTVALLERHITSALKHQPRRLVIDLSGVSFLSAAGVNLLIQVREIASAQDCLLFLRGSGRRPVMLALRALRVEGLFTTL